jgi:hypothetical protein
MSLISDALKKARQEAARQDAQRQGLPYAVGAADLPARRTSLLPLLMGLGAGGLLAVALLVFAWSAGWGPFAKPAPKAAQVAATAPAAPPSPVKPAAEPAAPPKAVAPETSPAPPPRPVPPARESRPQPPPVETRPAPPAETPVARPAPVTPAPSPPVTVNPVPPAPSPAAPARPSPAATPQGTGDLADGRSYVGEVPVPGGGAVKLNGIAFSKDHPIAVLDGRVVEPGEVVQGFTIVAIEDGRVELQGYGATVFVSPR